MPYFRETSISFFWVCGYNILKKFNEGDLVFADVEECHGVIVMTMYCQLEGLMLDVGVVVTPPGLPGERMVDHT